MGHDAGPALLCLATQLWQGDVFVSLTLKQVLVLILLIKINVLTFLKTIIIAELLLI